MTVFVMWKNARVTALNSPNHARDVFWNEATRPPVGWLMYFGHTDTAIVENRLTLPALTEGDYSLRVDIDLRVGRAVVRWIHHGLIGAQPHVGPCHTDLHIHETSSGPLTTLPAAWATVTPGGVVNAIQEYARTNQRPNCLNWTPFIQERNPRPD